jgi:chemotaxis protein MotA
MSASAAPLNDLIGPKQSQFYGSRLGGRLDISMMIGLAIASAAVVGGIAQTGVSLSYFLQPTGFLIVIVGTVGITVVTTPRAGLERAAGRVMDLLRSHEFLKREDLIEEIVSYARLSRTGGVLALEPIARNASHAFLQEALLFALDVGNRTELQTALEDKLRLAERQGEGDARVLETAGGFAPTVGVMGTVVGLIDALRRFTDLSSAASGMGVAFVSTVYGLALANLVLLPVANRIRAHVAEAFEVEELIAEGVLCVFDGIHPQLIRQRLACFCPEPRRRELMA